MIEKEVTFLSNQLKIRTLLYTITQPNEPAPASDWKRMWDEFLYGYFPNKPSFTPEYYHDLTVKIAIITGSNIGGIGIASVKLLYEKNCDVIMVVRHEAKGPTAREQTIKEIPNFKGNLSLVGGCDFVLNFEFDITFVLSLHHSNEIYR